MEVVETNLLIKSIPIPKENKKIIKSNEKNEKFNTVLNNTTSKPNKKHKNSQAIQKKEPHKNTNNTETPILFKRILIPKKTQVNLKDELPKPIISLNKKNNKKIDDTFITSEINEVIKTINDACSLKKSKKDIINTLKKTFPNKHISLKKVSKKDGSILNLIEVSDKNKKVLIPLNGNKSFKEIKKKIVLIKQLFTPSSKNNKTQKKKVLNLSSNNKLKMKGKDLSTKEIIKDKPNIKTNSENKVLYFVVPKEENKNNTLSEIKKLLNKDILSSKINTKDTIHIKQSFNLKKILLKVSKNYNFNEQKILKNETTLNFIKNDLFKNNTFNSSILTLKNYKFKTIEPPKRFVEKNLKINNSIIEETTSNTLNFNKSNTDNSNTFNKKFLSQKNEKPTKKILKKISLTTNKLKIKHEVPQLNLNSNKSNNKVSNENIKPLSKQTFKRVPLEKFNTKIEEVLSKNTTQTSIKESISMKITPPEIGKTSIEIIKNGKAVTVNIMTETENAKNTLSKTLHTLVGNLRDSGYNPVTVKIDSQEKEDLMQQEKENQQNHQEQSKKREKEKDTIFESILRGEENA